VKLIYVSGPISRGNLRENVRRACAAGRRLMAAGLAVIVPHLSVYLGQEHAAGCLIPEALPEGTTLAQWHACGVLTVGRCDAVLRLPGDSLGADLECAEARRLGVPVFEDEERLVAWAKGGGR
jgi:hypothetical protein